MLNIEGTNKDKHGQKGLKWLKMAFFISFFLESVENDQMSRCGIFHTLNFLTGSLTAIISSHFSVLQLQVFFF